MNNKRSENVYNIKPFNAARFTEGIIISFPDRYFLDSKEEDVRYFRIDESSGVIRTTQPLDREDVTWHNITVMASEVGRYPARFPLMGC